jgi:hypothetical protein
MRTVKPFVSQNALKTTYYSDFHSVMNYGLLFWGSSTESIKIFKLQKKMIRIMMGCKSNHFCRSLFANLEILPLPSQYIFSLLLFLNKNRNQFKTNSDIHHYATFSISLLPTWLNTRREYTIKVIRCLICSHLTLRQSLIIQRSLNRL